MKDIIDERNKREKMEKSIIKYWNVRYLPVMKEMQESQQSAETGGNEEAVDLAAEVLKRQDEAKRRIVEEAIEEDAIERGKIDKILHEKAEKIRNIVDQNGTGF